MSHKGNLRSLFSAINGCLPYEYDEKYIGNARQEGTIAISKTNSDHVIYINANTSAGDGVFDVTLYDDINDDDDPAETTMWDANDPNLTLMSLTAYIEKNL